MIHVPGIARRGSVIGDLYLSMVKQKVGVSGRSPCVATEREGIGRGQ